MPWTDGRSAVGSWCVKKWKIRKWCVLDWPSWLVGSLVCGDNVGVAPQGGERKRDLAVRACF